MGESARREPVPGVKWGNRTARKAAPQRKKRPGRIDPGYALKPWRGRAPSAAEIPTLHSRMKASCAFQGRDTTEALMEILKKNVPEKYIINEGTLHYSTYGNRCQNDNSYRELMADAARRTLDCVLNGQRDG